MIDWAQEMPDRQWQAIDGTLCFADISGFTALAERLAQRGRVGGEELIETLSRVFGSMLDKARERDGVLLKFGGDALLFLFTGEHHVLRAACAAIEMRQSLRSAAEIPTSVGRLRLSMSVGLHSGELHLFLVGSQHRELILAGAEISRVTETEAAANAGEIAVSSATASALPKRAVRQRDDGTLLLRWRKPPVSPSPLFLRHSAGVELIRGLFPKRLGRFLESGPPEPEHRVACMAFVRFSGTDEMLRTEGPDSVAAALQATIGIAQDLFRDEDITLLAVDIDRDGGKLFLGSGVPAATEDDAGRILRTLRRLADADTPLKLQFGVSRGHVFAAEVGTSWRAAYSAMGDTTNTAARICAKAPPGIIYAHPSVLEHSRTLFKTESVGPFTFKGKKVPQIVYQVGEAVGTLDQDHGEMPLVGRDDEFAQLQTATVALGKGVGGVVTVNGPVGLGKSRLLCEALNDLEGFAVITLRAESYSSSNAYHIFRDPVRDLLGITPGNVQVMQQQLVDGVARLAADLLPFAALLGDVAQVAIDPSPEVEALDARFRPERIADSLVRLLNAVHDAPLIIVMEDAQWADEASTRLLQRISDACAQNRWLLMVARRGDDGGFTPEEGPQIELEPLDTIAMQSLVNAATASAPLRPHEIDLVVERSGGNPLFAEEIIRTARDVGSLDAVPDSLEAVMAAQVDALDPDARRALRYATVLGQSFRVRTLEVLLEGEGYELDTAMLERLGRFLGSDDKYRLRFRNAFLCNAIYEGLAYRLRSRLHRIAGETLENLAADPGEQADDLATHFWLAGDAERAWRYARQAADRAKRAYANPDAARLYRMALDAARRLPELEKKVRKEVWAELGDVCDQAGMFDDALDAYRRASRLAGDDPVARAGLLLRRAYVRERDGAFVAALRELTAGQRQLDGIEQEDAIRLRAKLSAFSAMVRFAQERFRDALAEAEIAVEQSRAAGEKAALAMALVAAGSARETLGETDVESMIQALELYEEIGDLSSAAMVRGNLGCSAYLAGNWDEALDWFSSQTSTCQRAGNVVGAATAASNIGEILVKRGKTAEAEPILDDAIRTMRASRFHDGAAYAEIQLARILLKRDAVAEADEILGRVCQEFYALGQAASALESALVQVTAKVRLGQPVAALELLELAADAAGKDAQLFVPQVAEARACALDALDRSDEARVEINKGLTAARDFALPYEEAMLLLARARIAGEGDAAADLKAARKILGGLGIN